MPLIYVKLGVAIPNFEDEALDFNLDSITAPAGALDYSNINENIQGALKAGTIVQINEAQYFAIIQGLSVVPPIQITTNYLLTLNTYMTTCPTNGVVFFCYYNNQWFKITWQKIKECLGGGIKLNIRVGNINFPAPAFPQDGDSTFTNPLLIGKDPFNLVVRSNGVEIFYKLYYDVSELPDVDYWDLDPLTGAFTRPATFTLKEFFSIREA